MRSCVCFSVLQNPRCGMRLISGNPILTSTWFDNLRRIGRNSVKAAGTNSNRHPKEENKAALWVNETNRLSQEEARKVFIRKNSTHCDKPGILRREDVLGGFEGRNYVEEKIESQRSATILVFDIETTGFSRTKERIVEFAVRDITGGENSTFQSLVNPECNVPNTATGVHGISSPMVNRADVPRFRDLLPILRYYIQSRRVVHKPMLLVAHNARAFDVPFLISEFRRCSEEIPSDWLFLDTLPLARQLAKLPGNEILVKTSLAALREFYGIPIVGEAHRAMCDVDVLTRVLQLMTMDLKLPVSSLLERSFKAEDIVDVKKKKK